jgi:hypothetical protein
MNRLPKVNPFSLVFAILALTIQACNVIPSKPVSTITLVPTSTKPPMPSFTPTISIPPPPSTTSSFSPSITPSPSPTITSTPLPQWVTDFAQPIRDVISLRTPSFQDDFGTGSGGWKEEGCDGSMKYVEGELVVENCRVFRPNIDWRDFALEIDVRFLEGTNPSTEWGFHFRDLGNSGHDLILYHNGILAITFTKAKGASNRIEFDNDALSNHQIHHILLIARGNQFAFYLDSQPLYYTQNDEYRFGRCVFFVNSGTAAMDNFKIWDISTIPTP